MSDRSLIADTRAAARRATGQPEPALREQIAEELARIRGRLAETWIEVSRRDMQWLLAHVDLLTAERDGHRSGREQLRAISREHRAERDRYRLAWLSAGRRGKAERAKATRLVALMERGFDAHMQFGVIEPDGTTTMLPCADWCYACKLEKAEAEVAELERRNGKLAETIHAFPDAHDAANLAHARSERDRLGRGAARIRALHQQYRDVYAVGDQDSCSHCNQISGHVVPWPCPTITALDGAEAQP